MRSVGVGLILAILVSSSAAAQTAAAPASGFLARTDFAFQWAGLHASDIRFDWQGLVVYDFDIVEYGEGRVRFRGDYEAVLGRERRRYDLNQGRYFFEAAGTGRVGRTEFSGLMSHVSRHLADRENQPAISWNTVGARAHHAVDIGEFTIDGSLEAARTMQIAFVDYRWTSDLYARIRRPLGSKVGFQGLIEAHLIGVDRSLAGRKRQCGARLEGGLRIAGGDADLDVFAGYERRIDAYPTDRGRVRYFTVGFRISTN